MLITVGGQKQADSKKNRATFTSVKMKNFPVEDAAFRHES